MGSDGPVALSMVSISQGMEDYHVDDDERVEFSLKVRRIANVIISARAEEAYQKLKSKK